MTREKWESVRGKVLDAFTVLDKGEEHYDEEGGVDLEFVVFNGPLGKMRLEYIEKPVVLGKKTNYSNRIGSETAVEYVFSPTERTSRLAAYRWGEAEDDWVEIDAKGIV